MMNDIRIFENTEFGELEVLWENKKAFFPAIRCAEILGYKNPRKAVLDHCRGDGVTKRDVVSYTENQYGVRTEQIVTKKYISEGNLYRLIVRSKLESAQRFEKWVFDEVLPTIREHGFYASDDVLEQFLNDPDMAIGAFTKLKEARDKVRGLEAENRELIQKCSYLDIITACKDAIPITVIAHDYGMSAVDMNRELKHFGIQYRMKCGTWILYQKYKDEGYTKSVTFVYDKANGRSSIHTYWTQKGRLFIYEKLKEKGILPVCERSEDDDRQ